MFSFIYYRFVSSLERFTTLLTLSVDNETGKIIPVTRNRNNVAIFVEENEMVNGRFPSSQILAIPREEGSGEVFTSTMTTTSINTAYLNSFVFEAVQRTSNSNSSLRVNAILFNPNSPLFPDNSTNGTGSSILSLRITPGDAPTNLTEPVTFLFLNVEVNGVNHIF